MAESRPADAYALLDQAAEHQRLESEAAKFLAATRSRLILGRDAKSVFFAVLALRLKLIADWQCETMETDGVTLQYNPAFVCGLSPDERLGVLVHEVMHNALAHPHRRGVREPSRWNLACDLAVNPLLIEAGFMLPAGRLMPGEGHYSHLDRGSSAEDYYSQLEQQQPAESSSPDPGGCGGVRDPKPQDGQNECDCAQAVVQAREASRTRGELPGGLARLVDEVVHPPTDWRTLLREFLNSHAHNDFSWLRPNRRFLPQGLYLPGLYSEELGEVVIAVDTSGSVNEQQLAVFAQEIEDILEAFQCGVTILYHDTVLQGEHRWHSSDGPLKLDPVGGGGTSHEWICEWLLANDSQPSCIVCLTDLETQFPSQQPDVPVLWAVIGDSSKQPPFGQRVRIGL